jgi:hypothetical protein
MLRHCTNVATFRYGWSPSHPLPEGKDPEQVVDEVLRAYLTGTRNLSEEWPVEAQLKRGIESRLWALHQRLGSQAVSFDLLSTGANGIAAEGPSTDFEAADNHDTRILFQLLRQTPDVQECSELQAMVAAVERGSDDPHSQSEGTGIPIPRIYELRRRLKAILPAVLSDFNKGAALTQ